MSIIEKMQGREKRAANLLDGSIAVGFAGSALTMVAGLLNIILLQAPDRACGIPGDPCGNIAATLTGGLILIGFLQFWASYLLWKRSPHGATISIALGIFLIFLTYATFSIVSKGPPKYVEGTKEITKLSIIAGYEFLAYLYSVLSPIALGSGILAWYSYHIAPPVERIANVIGVRP